MKFIEGMAIFGIFGILNTKNSFRDSTPIIFQGSFFVPRHSKKLPLEDAGSSGCSMCWGNEENERLSPS